MARRPKQTVPPQVVLGESAPVRSQTYEPDALYAIKVGRVADAMGVRFRPSGTYKVKGKVVDALGDAVISSERA